MLRKANNNIINPAVWARMNLISYVIGLMPNYRVGDHHRLIASKLMAVERGECKRLMIFMPPRHGKSLLCTIFFPSWYLGLHPERKVFTFSYNETIAEDFGSGVKGNLQNSAHRTFFPKSELRTDSKSKTRLHTISNGAYYATGFGGTATGRGGNIIIIDDPIKSREEADSEAKRRSIRNYYTSSIRNRIEPEPIGTAIILIQTRWHNDDLAGWLLKEHQHENWEVLSLPAINVNGEALWPEGFSLKILMSLKQASGSRDWAALYMQKPMLDDGGIIKMSWFNNTRYLIAPRFFRIIQSWDTANKAKELNDYCVCTTWGETFNGWYLIDVFRKRLEYPDLKHAAKNCASKWNPSVVLIEDKGSGQSLIQDLRRNTRIPVIAIEPHNDKIVRMSSVSPLMEAEKIWLPETAPWLIDYEVELSTFPLAANDDQVDSTSQALQYLKDNQLDFTVVAGNELETNSMFARY
ncbi:MAG: phage terminase large subunit [Candidatus Riflebacteria bacterium]|nr:phage terminase large subunit [Candidatus Riflebacteria bacterium]